MPYAGFLFHAYSHALLVASLLVDQTHADHRLVLSQVRSGVRYAWREQNPLLRAPREVGKALCSTLE